MIEYNQAEDSWELDHFPVEFKCDIDFSIYKKKTNRISTKKTNWRKYRGILMDREEDMEKEEYKSLTEADKYRKIEEIMIEATLEALAKRIE